MAESGRCTTLFGERKHSAGEDVYTKGRPPEIAFACLQQVHLLLACPSDGEVNAFVNEIASRPQVKVAHKDS